MLLAVSWAELLPDWARVLPSALIGVARTFVELVGSAVQPTRPCSKPGFVSDINCRSSSASSGVGLGLLPRVRVGREKTGAAARGARGRAKRIRQYSSRGGGSGVGRANRAGAVAP